MSARFTRGEKAAGGVLIAFWIIGALLSLAMTAAIIWGIIKVVSWLVAQ